MNMGIITSDSNFHERFCLKKTAAAASPVDSAVTSVASHTLMKEVDKNPHDTFTSAKLPASSVDTKVCQIAEQQGLTPISSIQLNDNLKDEIDKPLKEKEKLVIARDIIKELKSLSSKPKVHLAIIPENILLKRGLDGKTIIGAYLREAPGDFEESTQKEDILFAGNLFKELFKRDRTILYDQMQQMCNPNPHERPNIDELLPVLDKIEIRNSVLDTRYFLQANKISLIIERDLQTIFEYIIKNRSTLQARAELSPKGVIYVRTGLPRAIQFNADGKVYIHFNKAKCKDHIFGKGSFKRVRVAMDFDSKSLYAVARSSITTPNLLTIADNEIKFLKKFAGKKGVAQIVEEVKVIGKRGEEKSFAIQPIYNEGTLGTLPNTISEEKKFKIVLDLLEGLANLEEEKVIHRDIKLENIFLNKLPDETLEACIADFGLACMSDDKKGKSVLCGSPAYCDPQRVKAYHFEKVLRKMSADMSIASQTLHKGDMWSFGVTLYSWLHGTHPLKFEKETPVDQMIKTLAELTEDPFKIAPNELDDPIENLIYDCLRLDDHDRISAKEALVKYRPLLQAHAK